METSVFPVRLFGLHTLITADRFQCESSTYMGTATAFWFMLRAILLAWKVDKIQMNYGIYPISSNFLGTATAFCFYIEKQWNTTLLRDKVK